MGQHGKCMGEAPEVTVEGYNLNACGFVLVNVLVFHAC